MKKVSELFKGIRYKLINMDRDFAFVGLSSDSRTIEKGELFIAVKGWERDGHNFINEAFNKGAAAVCSECIIKDAQEKKFIIIKDTAKALPLLASRFFEEPSRFLKSIGITGTNGKTTTSHLIYEILKTAGKTPSLLGTVQHRIGDKIIFPRNTTPGPALLHSFLNQMKNYGTDYIVMEVSSHALKQSRVSGVNFSSAVLTNITGDHLDYHGNMRDYANSKRFLFESLNKDSFAILNSDDKFCDEFSMATQGKVITYGIAKKADFKATHIETDIDGSRFFMDTPDGTIAMRTSLVGRHNIYNILAAAAVSFTEGIKANAVCEAIGRFAPVTGRLEPVLAGQPFKIFIDYAHTHDALKKILSEFKEICSGKIIVVFGCGGNRDKSKRPKMGKLASCLADYVILTSDNPRDEDPDIILDEIEKGFDHNFNAYKRIPDRFKAIEKSLRGRNASDVVIIAGKGHEDYQIIGDKRIPFNDKKVVKEILNKADHV